MRLGLLLFSASLYASHMSDSSLGKMPDGSMSVMMPPSCGATCDSYWTLSQDVGLVYQKVYTRMSPYQFGFKMVNYPRTELIMQQQNIILTNLDPQMKDVNYIKDRDNNNMDGNTNEVLPKKYSFNDYVYLTPYNGELTAAVGLYLKGKVSWGSCWGMSYKFRWLDSNRVEENFSNRGHLDGGNRATGMSNNNMDNKPGSLGIYAFLPENYEVTYLRALDLSRSVETRTCVNEDRYIYSKYDYSVENYLLTVDLSRGWCASPCFAIEPHFGISFDYHKFCYKLVMYSPNTSEGDDSIIMRLSPYEDIETQIEECADKWRIYDSATNSSVWHLGLGFGIDTSNRIGRCELFFQNHLALMVGQLVSDRLFLAGDLDADQEINDGVEIANNEDDILVISPMISATVGLKHYIWEDLYMNIAFNSDYFWNELVGRTQSFVDSAELVSRPRSLESLSIAGLVFNLGWGR